MATGHSTFTSAVTRTLQKHGTKIFDAVSDNNALFFLMRKAGNIKLSGGGRTFTHPLFYQVNSSFKTYAPLAVIDTPIVDDLTRAEFSIKTAAGSMVLSTLEVAKNAGQKEKLLDYGEEIRMGAEISMRQMMGLQTYKDGSVATDFGGIPYLVNSSPSTQTTVGGITGVGNVYWRNIVGDAVTAFNTSDAGVKSWAKSELDATKGINGPTVIACTKAIYRLYEVSLTGTIRHQDPDLKIGNKHFKHLLFGAIPVIPDDNCTTDVSFSLDLETLWLQILAKGNFRTTPFQPSHDQLSETALMYVFGNFTCGSRRTQVYTSVTG